MKKSAQFERWMWIELIGFDRDQRDYGVQALCERAGFTPQAVTLLLSDPEFVHGHTGRLTQVLGHGVCSYGGHPYNEERQRQDWSARDLRGLVRTLQKKNISVYFCHFDTPVGGWLAAHQELRVLTRKAEWMTFISPYKRLADGRPYRDLYLPQLARVVTDYGFDGFHAGDGLAHPRLPIYEGDFSADTVSQYLTWSGDSLPSRFAKEDEHAPEVIQSRAAWIWRERRLSWIQFHSERTTGFWTDAAEMLQGLGKKLVFNSCWTRDPFEALYRYGVDYAALHRGGVHAFLAETASAVQELGGDLSYGEPGGEDWEPHGTIRKFTTNLQLLRAAVPQAKIIFMNGIKDTNEAWNGIRHAPTNLESEILSHTGVFSVTDKKTLRPAADGVISVLSDGLSSVEWKWIRDRWDLGFSLRPKSALGAAVYLGEHFAEKLTTDYIAHRSVPLPQILSSLSLAGAPISVTVQAGQLSHWEGPVLVVHPHLLSDAEWQQLLQRKKWPLFTVGGPAPAGPGRTFDYQYGAGKNPFCISVFHSRRFSPQIGRLPHPRVFQPSRAQDPFQWLKALPAPAIPEALYHAIATSLIQASGGIRMLHDNPDVRAWAYVLPAGGVRLYARNESFYYRHCAIELPFTCKKVRTLTAFPGNPVVPDHNILRFKMAGKSIAVFDLTPAKPPSPKRASVL